MTPKRTPDPEYPEDPDQNGTRKDGRDLIAEWLNAKQVVSRGRGNVIPGTGCVPLALALLSLAGCPLCLGQEGPGCGGRLCEPPYG